MKKIVTMLLVMLQLALCVAGVSAETEDYSKGLTFQNEAQHYTTSGTLSKYPQTFEATVYFPVDTPTDETYAKTIVGNYVSNVKVPGVDLQIFNGKPRLAYSNSSKTYCDPPVDFDKVNVYTGEWVHIAVTAKRATDRDFKCYINGELVQSVTSSYSRYYFETNPGFLGKTTVGGRRGGGINAWYFKDGIIKNIAVYHDIRTADEIAQDCEVAKNGGTVDYSDILLHYDFSGISVGEHPAVIEDLSAADDATGDDLQFDTWIEPEDMPERSGDSYDFSLAVIGDIQCINYFYYDAETGTNPSMAKMFDWVVANKDTKKMAGAFVLGDLTQTSESGTETPLPDDMEWKLARAEIDKLKAAMPVSVIRGNHENTGEYAQYFPYEDFADGIDGCYIDTTDEAEVTEGYSDARDTYTDAEKYQKSANMLNTYQKLRVGEQKYLILNLDIGAADDVLEWAGGVCEAHPEYTVIVNTHAALHDTPADFHTKDYASSPAYSAAYWKLGARNNGNDLWNKFFSQHENISLILCGHVSSDEIVVNKKTGIHGNEVTTMLIDPQSLDQYTDSGTAYGMVAMLYFKDGGKTIDVEWYSTGHDKYLLARNQFSTELNVVQNINVSDISFIGDAASVSATVIGETETVVQPAGQDTAVSFSFAENTRENQVEVTTGAADKDVSGISASVSLSGKLEGLVYAALYDKDGKMMGLKIKEPAASVSFAFEEPGSEVKVFWWKSAVDSLTAPAKITFK